MRRPGYVVRNIPISSRACWGDPNSLEDWQDLPFDSWWRPNSYDALYVHVFALDPEDAALAASIVGECVVLLDEVEHTSDGI